MGRALGKLTGRATGFIYKARAQLFDFAEKSELTKVQQELQMTMQQLQAIRSELQGGINILDPGPLSRHILGRGGTGAGGRGAGGILDKSSSVENSNNSANLSTQQQQSTLPFAASGVTAAAAAAAPREGITAHGTSIGSFQAAVPVQAPTPLHQPLQQHQNQPFEVLPISAAAARLIPDRSQSKPTASEILADALQEEKVAHQARQFFQQQQQQLVVDSNHNRSGSSSSNSTVKEPRKPRATKKGGTE
jgi:hypothetical protein